MNDSLFPHYHKIKYLLDQKQRILYKSLTKKYKKSKFIRDNTSINVLKHTSKVLVFTYKENVIKLIFESCSKYKNELYYSDIFYDNMNSLSVKNACMLIVPKYETDLKNVIPIKCDHKNSIKQIYQLIFGLVKQVFSFHSNYIVHHDIKPANIVKTKEFKWKIIDFGHMLYHKPNYLESDSTNISCNKWMFNRGSKIINIPEYSLDCSNNKEQLFWIYMKDWFGVVNSIIANPEFYNFIEEIKDYVQKNEYKIDLNSFLKNNKKANSDTINEQYNIIETEYIVNIVYNKLVKKNTNKDLEDLLNIIISLYDLRKSINRMNSINTLEKLEKLKNKFKITNISYYLK